MKIIETFSALRRTQSGIIKPCRLTVSFKHSVSKTAHAVIIAVFGHFKSCPLCKILHGIDIVKISNFHNKRDDISAYSATKTIERTVFGIYIKRGSFFAVERT